MLPRSDEQFTSEYRMEAPFQRREANHPKAGEYVKVVAINRATGYIGTARARLAAGEVSCPHVQISYLVVLKRIFSRLIKNFGVKEQKLGFDA